MVQTKRAYEQQKMAKLTQGLGIGQGAVSMVKHQKIRDGRGRGHGDLTLDQGYDVTAELLIRQGGRCWVTGTKLVVNGCADSLRSYSIDRLDDSRGYRVGNCRAVCVWVNLATAYASHSKIQLWRHLSQLPPLTAPNNAPDFSSMYTDRSQLRRFICTPVKGSGSQKTKLTQARAQNWLPFFDSPPIAPLSTLTDDQVMELIAG